MSKTITILTDESTRGDASPLIAFTERAVVRPTTESGIVREEPVLVLGRVGNDYVVITEQEARALLPFITQLLKG